MVGVEEVLFDCKMRNVVIFCFLAIKTSQYKFFDLYKGIYKYIDLDYSPLIERDK